MRTLGWKKMIIKILRFKIIKQTKINKKLIKKLKLIT